MTRSFNRQIRVVFTNRSTGEDLIPDGDRLNIGFTVERNLDIEPSTADITIFNLRRDTVDKLIAGVPTVEPGERPPTAWIVELSAGYFDPRVPGRKPDESGVHTIFKGDVRRIQNRREPPLLATDIEADDGGEASKKFVTKHFPPNTSVGTVFKFLQDQALPGSDPRGRNATRFTQIRTPKGIPDRLKNGMTVRGYAMEELNDLARSRGSIVSSQGNELVVLRRGEALQGVPTTKISPTTGLIGYPSEDPDGTVLLNHKMLPNVFPGSPLDITSDFINKTIVVERAVYSGSLFENDFNIEVEGVAQL